MLRFFAHSAMPLARVTMGVSLAPMAQAVQRSVQTEDIPYTSLANAFAAPEPSSPLVDWMLGGRLGDCLEWFGEAGASLGREFIPQQSIVEHQQELKHYTTRLTNALIEGSFNEEDAERDTVFEMSDLLHYVYHAKQLLQKTEGDVAQEIDEQLAIFYSLAKHHSEAVARPFDELRQGLAQQYALESNVFSASRLDETRQEKKFALVKQAIFSKKQRGSIGIANKANRKPRQMNTNSPLAEISLSSLNGVNGFAIKGEEYDRSDRSVSGAGDVNGDGIADILIGVPSAGDNGAGKSYAVFGRASGWDTAMSLESLDGSNGFVLIGEADDGSGHSVSSAGDVNGDGLADILIGARHADNYAGKSYVVFGRALGWNATMSLGSLDGSNGFVLTGEMENDDSGDSVSGAGDVNGDGIDDVLIGASGADNHAGKSYVVFGRASYWNATMSLGSLDGSNGFVLTGEEAVDRSGSSVSGAGDVNADGIADILIGAPNADNYAGKSYVVFGRTSEWNATMSLANLDGSNGFVLIGEADDGSGDPVSAAGDVNGDGIDDVLIGASGANNYAGKSYVVFGRTSEWNATMSLGSLNGSNGFVLMGEALTGEWIYLSDSSSVSSADANGDGLADILIRAFDTDSEAGKSYVVFGGLIQISAPPIPTPVPAPAPSTAPTPTPSISSTEIKLSNLNNTTGMVYTGEAGYDNSGWSVSSAGDINGDGIDDVIIGAPYANATGKRSGKSYVIFGNMSNPEPFLNLSGIDSSNGFVIAGESEYDYTGWSVSAVGDINADGLNDVLLGAFRAASNGIRTGKGYVIFGKSSGFSSVLNVSNLNGSNGFVLVGEVAFDALGYSVSNAGDVNGDKVDDVIIGAPFASTNGLRSGKGYVIFGQRTGFASVLNLASLNGTNGFVLTGEAAGDQAGYTVSSAGDMNGDGVDDVIIGAPYAVDTVTGLAAGKAYVVFGKKSSPFVSSLALSSLNGKNGFVITGEATGDYLGFSVSGAGDMNRDGLDDMIIGAPRAGLEGTMVGKSYVLFGQASGFVRLFSLENLDGSNGFVVTGGAAGDKSGYSVKGAGDINGDGFADVIIGAPYAAMNGTKSGKSYVIYGGAATFPAAIDLSQPNTVGIVFIGEAEGDRMGWSVSGAGDFNGDKIDDVIIGAPRADIESIGLISAGKSYVVFGIPAPPSPPTPSPLSSGAIAGIAVGAAAGLALVAAIAKFGIWDRYISPPPAPERAQSIMP